MKAAGEKKMSLEEYVEFFVSKNFIAFTISYLNQILHMHGYRKLHKSQKKVVGEAVDALDLLDLSRSTLKQTGISSSSASASLTLDEVVVDIEALKWQECCLTSLQIINSDQVTSSVTKPTKNKRSYKRKKVTMMKKSLKFGHEYDDDDDDDYDDETKKKMKKTKKKKSIKSVNEAAAKSSSCVVTIP
ncbi:hypothetical protein AALP_AA2G050900 [Arabis alpina]|uniref:DUF7787 domain-containing protein n=1 Tax=Arabis alpina TaxID=50452 RepID=A0A087HFF8_ARAAL|nr:hypothetical protein AALP_AA2G050900 [Arabis alpina]